MEKLLNDFKEARETLINAINDFPADKRDDKLFGEWSLKDVVAHFAAWDIYFTEVLKPLTANKSVPYYGKIKDFNDAHIAKQRDWNWDRVYSEFLKAGENFISDYQKLSPILFKKPFWPGKKYSPVNFLKINVEHYKKAQLKDIQKLNTKFNKI
jgi:hypothetical protein